MPEDGLRRSLTAIKDNTAVTRKGSKPRRGVKDALLHLSKLLAYPSANLPLAAHGDHQFMR